MNDKETSFLITINNKPYMVKASYDTYADSWGYDYDPDKGWVKDRKELISFKLFDDTLKEVNKIVSLDVTCRVMDKFNEVVNGIVQIKEG